MADVYLWSGVRNLIQAEHPLKVDGKTLEELLNNLIRNYPEFRKYVPDVQRISTNFPIGFDSVLSNDNI